MLTRTDAGVWQSTLLTAVPGVRHGFATRHAPEWPGKYVRVHQTHSSTVLIAETIEGSPEADGLVTAAPGHWIGIRTADCVPLLIAERSGKAVAAVHAGWRGTAAQIARIAVDRMQAEFGCAPKHLVAAIGPCIGLCCFEVGPEVAEVFPSETDGRHVDLPAANRRQLIEAGIPEAQIDSSGLCTMCNRAEFHSWRRDREASGRMVAAIRIG